ncbi:hypothetical protein N7512_002444 [Penicillium capsulatum]|nr:hypothetical protein N7512_002444 [Penicillium capsulatum]
MYPFLAFESRTHITSKVAEIWCLRWSVDIARSLISKDVIPEPKASWETTSLGIMIRVVFASGERSAADWRELVQSTGLKLHKTWTQLA